MRTTVTLADDVAAAVKTLRRAEGLGMSDAVNRLVREGLTKPKAASRYEHKSYNMGLKVDVTNVGEVLAMLDDLD